MQGEDGKTAAGTKSEEGNYQSKAPLQRLAVVLAGPIANFILALVILLISAFAFGIPSDHFSPMIGPVSPGSPGARAGLQFGDRVLAVDGIAVNGETMVQKIRAAGGVPLRFRIMRNGEINTIVIVPERRQAGHGKAYGIVGFQRVQEFHRVAPGLAVHTACLEFSAIFIGSFTGVAALLSDPLNHYSSAVGIIGMERAASQLQDLGWGPYFGLAATISMALGIFNLLPIPALDGGRALFILVEFVRGRPIDPEREAFVHVAGFALLMALMVFIAFHDIVNLISGKGVF